MSRITTSRASGGGCGCTRGAGRITASQPTTNSTNTLDAYLNAGQIADDKGTPLFRRLDRRRRLTSTRLTRREALAVAKRRAIAAGLGDRVCNHSFHATRITAYLESGGTLRHAQRSLPTSRHGRPIYTTVHPMRCRQRKSSGFAFEPWA